MAPYLLGGRPSRGDFGMMAPLFAHLGRDPVPAGIMKAKAPNLFRWTERMNSTPISDGEYPGYAETYAADDAIPETFSEAVMCVAFADWLPGLIADADCFNAWAADKEEGAIVSRTGDRQVHPNVGKVEFDWRGVTYRRGSQPHMLWMLAAAQAHYAGMNVEAKARAETALWAHWWQRYCQAETRPPDEAAEQYIGAFGLGNGIVEELGCGPGHSWMRHRCGRLDDNDVEQFCSCRAFEPSALRQNDQFAWSDALALRARMMAPPFCGPSSLRSVPMTCVEAVIHARRNLLYG